MSQPIKDMNGNWAKLFKLLLGSYVPLVLTICGAQAYFFTTIGAIKTDVSLNKQSSLAVKENLHEVKRTVEDIEDDIIGIREKVIVIPLVEDQAELARQKANAVRDLIDQTQDRVARNEEAIERLKEK